VKGKNVRRFSWWLRLLVISSFATLVLGAASLAAILSYFSASLPKVLTLADYRPQGVTRIFAAPPRGSTEPTLVGEFKEVRRYLVPFEKLPDIVIRAFISAEDDKFFEHGGSSLQSMLRATLANLKAGHWAQGGSTITQQVVKTLLLTSEKSLTRKIKELLLANEMEKNLSKQQILYLYLNQIYLGHNAYGVQAAARTYFRKDVWQLSIAEAAVLAGLPQAPSKYSPVLNPKKAKERQLYVLRRMMENHYISSDEMKAAAATQVKIFSDEETRLKAAPYLVEQVRRQLQERYGDNALYKEGLTVFLPATEATLRAGGQALREGLRTVDKRMGYRGPHGHLKTAQELDQFVAKYRRVVVDKKIGFQYLTTDGRLDFELALQTVSDPFDVFEPTELYEGVVTSVDDTKKMAIVNVGGYKIELPLERIKWARPPKDEKNPNAPRLEPKVMSKIFAVGDLIWVKVLPASKGHPVLQASLEQIPQVQAALLSFDLETGAVLAMEGGYDFTHSEFNRAVQAQRQPGSAFKPILYSAGLERGFTPASIIVDAPLVYEDETIGKWKPTNYEEKFYGDTTFRQALIRSRNIPTIKIAQAAKIPFVIEYAKRLGLNSNFPQDLSISLGSSTTTLWDLTRVYALYPRLGRRLEPILYSKVIDRDGKVLEERKPNILPTEIKIPKSDLTISVGSPSSEPVVFPSYPPQGDPDQLLDPRVAYVMTHLMKEVVDHGTGHDAKALGRPVAGKTGTTTDSVDAWFMAFTPQIVTGVWVGYDGQRSMGGRETGASAALPIWLSYMKEVVKDLPVVDFRVPPGVVFVTVDSQTGKPTSASSARATQEVFVEGTEPKEVQENSRVAPEGTQSDFYKEDLE
jgi:penicillin-binding protein 1A